jgi:hypothetical protein
MARERRLKIDEYGVFETEHQNGSIWIMRGEQHWGMPYSF